MIGKWLAFRLGAPAGIAALLCTGACAAAGSGVLFFDAYAIAPQQIGDSLQVRGVIFPGELPPPLSLDFDEYQHTIVFAPPLAAIGDAVDFFATATLAVYSDPRQTGTRADPAQPASYVDGACILRARLRDFLHSNFGPPGYAAGRLEWTGGSRVQELSPPPSVLSADWTTLDPDLPNGYHEVWLGQLYPLIDAVEPRTWSAIKTLYRENPPARR